MYTAKVNNKKSFTIKFSNPLCSEGTVNDTNFVWDLLKIKDGSYHAIKNNASYNIEVIEVNYSKKLLTVSINGNKYEVLVKDKYDELLKLLGIDNLSGNKVNEIKAPMPGLVIDIIVREGTEVKKGDSLLVLEAMKMENIIKSPADGVIKKINIKKGTAVEKNQVLINFN